MKNLVVSEEFDNKNLVAYLQHQFDGLGLNTIYKALRKKDIAVNGERIKENITLHQNDNIVIHIPDKLLCKQCDIDIMYEDDNISVVNKPVGIEVIGSNSDNNDLTRLLHEHYRFTNDFPLPCHRLDRNTSGLVLFAKNETALGILLKKFKNQEIEKHYLATVYGVPEKKEDTITGYLFKDSKKSMVYISDEPKKGYQKIVTSYSVIDKDDFINRTETSLVPIRHS